MTQPPTAPSLFRRSLAGGYDWIFERIDRQGSGEHRRRLVHGATGEVLEIGAGTGRNLELYESADRVVALEPDPGMRARAIEAARGASVPVEVVDGRAEALPFPDGSFYTVVASYVLCSLRDQSLALREARRVLRSGGALRFYEHVRARDPKLARWQDRLERLWGWLGRGRHPNRDTVAAIESAQFWVRELDDFDFGAMPPIIRRHVIGVATRLN